MTICATGPPSGRSGPTNGAYGPLVITIGRGGDAGVVRRPLAMTQPDNPINTAKTKIGTAVRRTADAQDLRRRTRLRTTAHHPNHQRLAALAGRMLRPDSLSV